MANAAPPQAAAMATGRGILRPSSTIPGFGAFLPDTLFTPSPRPSPKGRGGEDVGAVSAEPEERWGCVGASPLLLLGWPGRVPRSSKAARFAPWQNGTRASASSSGVA